MAFARVWDATYEASPPGSQAANQLDTRIQEVKTDIRERIDVEHHMPGTGSTEDGVHKFPEHTLATRDAIGTPKDGQLVRRSDTRSIDIYDLSDTKWIEFMAWKVGDMKMAAYDDAADPGWVKADGASLLRTGIFADLFAVIGVEYGNVDASHFNVPKMDGRLPIGIDAADVDFDAMGETGGDKAKTIAEANLPSHAHALTAAGTSSDGVHDHDLQYNDNPTAFSGTARVPQLKDNANPASSLEPIDDAGAHTHTLTGLTDTIGSGTAQDVMNPFITMQWYIKL